jgi:hypothetical protein
MRLLGSAPKSHLCDQRSRSKVTGLSDLMTLFVDLGCLYCKQTQRAFRVFKNTLNWLKIDSVDQKFNWLECGNFSQDARMPGTESVVAFSQLAVKGLNCFTFGQICKEVHVTSQIFYEMRKSPVHDGCVPIKDCLWLCKKKRCLVTVLCVCVFFRGEMGIFV